MTHDCRTSTVSSVPTPRHTVRVHPFLWRAVGEVAKEQDETRTDIAVFAFEEEVRRHRPDLWREYQAILAAEAESGD